jgi:arsenate reductase
MEKRRVLILCTGNSARSQMAEGLLRHDAGERFDVESAGTKAGTLRPEAIAAMKELDIDISGHRSKHVDEFEGQQFDYVITVCDTPRKAAHYSWERPRSCIAALTTLHRLRRERRRSASRFSGVSAMN